MAAYFELVKEYQDHPELYPQRKTAESAGYDFYVADDIVIPPYDYLQSEIVQALSSPENILDPHTLEEMAALTKFADAKITLVPTGVKCHLDPGTYLELSVRSSCPLKYWLILGNGVGIIDGDYYNNPDNEGHIYFQLINLSPCPIILKKGDAIGQGIIKQYIKVQDDNVDAARVGGFGSTDV